MLINNQDPFRLKTEMVQNPQEFDYLLASTIDSYFLLNNFTFGPVSGETFLRNEGISMLVLDWEIDSCTSSGTTLLNSNSAKKALILESPQESVKIFQKANREFGNWFGRGGFYYSNTNLGNGPMPVDYMMVNNRSDGKHVLSNLHNRWFPLAQLAIGEEPFYRNWQEMSESEMMYRVVESLPVKNTGQINNLLQKLELPEPYEWMNIYIYNYKKRSGRK